MGEILVACFVAVWLTLAGVLAYIRLKKDYQDPDKKQEGTKR